jgi:hypothetical protein
MVIMSLSQVHTVRLDRVHEIHQIFAGRKTFREEYFVKSRILPSFLVAASLLALSNGPASAATCTATNFEVDGINMTAAQINPPGTFSAVLDATGCNIGIFYDHAGSGAKVNGASISGANYFGVVVDGDAGSVDIDVKNSTIQNIGDTPQNGTQHGNGIFYMNASNNPALDDSRTCNSTTNSVTGTISGNTVNTYQKNGITVKCPGVSVAINNNEVTGAGEAPLSAQIAQNGIEVGIGASAGVSGNAIADNEYTGPNGASSSGILVFGGAGEGGALTVGVQISGNKESDNDVGIFSVNCNDADCVTAPTTPTNNHMAGNSLVNNEISNVSGCGGVQGYQAGISELGNGDKITGNHISGVGYTTNNHTCGDASIAAVFDIDTTGSTGAKIHGNHPQP